MRSCVPVWPSLVVASSLPAPGLCHVTGPSTSRSQLRSARRAERRDGHVQQLTIKPTTHSHGSTFLMFKRPELLWFVKFCVLT